MPGAGDLLNANTEKMHMHNTIFRNEIIVRMDEPNLLGLILAVFSKCLCNLCYKGILIMYRNVQPEK